MSQLPPHPDLDQLRRRARELQRAAAADAGVEGGTPTSGFNHR
jgi:hypothetical protein